MLLFKIVSISRQVLTEVSQLLEGIPELEEEVITVLYFDARFNSIWEPTGPIMTSFPEQIFPFEVKRYGNIYYLSTLPDLKPLPPNKIEPLMETFKSLAPVSAIINFGQ